VEGQGPWEEDDPEIPKISLHDISSVQNPQTMCISNTIKKTRVVILIDTGSTHNFLSTDLAEQLGLEPDMLITFEVLLANRERLSSKGKYSTVHV
jgi:hypothetical protein